MNILKEDRKYLNESNDNNEDDNEEMNYYSYSFHSQRNIIMAMVSEVLSNWN